MLRIFIGIDIPEVIKEKIKRLYDLFKKEGSLKPVEFENIHITLKFLGNVEEVMLDKINYLLSSITFKSFDIVLKDTGIFLNRGNPSVFFINIFSENLLPLFKIIEEKMLSIGFPKERREFKPHLTIARGKGKVSKEFVNDFLNYKTGNMNFIAKNFVLYKSDLKPSGPIYTKIKVYNLI